MIASLAAAIKAHLLAAGVSASYEILPKHSKAITTGLQAYILPEGIEIELLGRKGGQNAGCTFDIMLKKSVATDDECKALLAQVEGIIEGFAGFEADGYSLTEIDAAPLIDYAKLDAEGIFASNIRISMG